jgi:FKBP-type peptidyl-prolyl cis-trans isomerase FkpA
MNPRFRLLGLLALAVALVAGGIWYSQHRSKTLRIEDLTVGSGPEAVVGSEVTVDYVGTLENGKVFDSSYTRNKSFTFSLGRGHVIRGWDQGLLGMKVGGKRKLTIPSDLAYGEGGIPHLIPPNSRLIFEVELKSIAP